MPRSEIMDRVTVALEDALQGTFPGVATAIGWDKWRAVPAAVSLRLAHGIFVAGRDWPAGEAAKAWISAIVAKAWTRFLRVRPAN